MAMEKILAPEIGLIQSDEFYLFYEMLMQSLKTDDVKEGIHKSLYILKSFLKSGNIAIYTKNENGVYVFKMSDSNMSRIVQSVSCIINKTYPLIEQKEIFNLDLKLGKLDNMTFVHTKIANVNNGYDNCIISIINNDKNKVLEPHFWERVKDTMQIILKRAASYERNTKAISTDLLTGLENRNSYEIRMQSINEEDENLVLGIFDLFRLKTINDTYSHSKGDVYIKSAASILNKYWPKQKIILNDDGIEEYKNTGHCVYRFGGDEFVLLTNVENIQLATIKAGLVKDESNLIDLNIGEKIPLGLNFGIVKHIPGESIKKTFIKADEMMQEDKKEMYKKYKLERRH